MKKTIVKFLMALGLLAAISCQQVEDVRQYAPIETFPEDTVFQNIEVKKAMIVIAHDDDMCAMSGTVSILNKKGWEIAVVSFSSTPGRNAAQIKACRHILDTVMFVDLKPEQYRNDLGHEKNPYYAIPKANFDSVFNKSLVETEFIKRINDFGPSIIFTLDNEIGGYGHPEHVLISQMVIDLATEKRITPLYIYQSVFTDHMENSIMERHSKRMKSWGFPGDEWDNAKKIYAVSGMPEPTVQVNIRSEAGLKMEYLRSYNKREREILGFFFPEFEKYSAQEYFTIFDREFFRIVEI
jgi:N-acetylglucosamine malate deacetylase 2